MEVTVKIFRYNPEKDTRGHYETYKIEADPNDRVLDVLEHIKGKTDGTLSFRRSCAHGVCGSDAMRINGRNMLACKTLVRDVGASITVEGTRLGVASGRNGDYIITGVPPGRHRLVFTHAACRKTLRVVNVEAWKSFTLNVQLERRPPTSGY